VPTGETAFQFFNTHEHDAEYESTGLVSLFDDGNTGVSTYGDNSRRQTWQVHEATMAATRVVNVDLGSYAWRHARAA
jgi:hypothetical protein